MTHYQPADSLRSARFVGVPTFARLPLVQSLDDVDVAIIGVPFDTGVAFRPGGRFGPNAVRAASVMIRLYDPILRISPFDVLSCVDFGDVAVIPGYIVRSYAAIESTVGQVVRAGVVPILLGGDHSCTLGHLRALKSLGPLAIVDFDSHTDAWDSFYGEKYNHGTWMRRAVEEGLVDVEHSIEVGLHGTVYGPDDWTMLRDELGLSFLSTDEVVAKGPDRTAATILERVADRPAFLSFDIDVVDPAFAPGTSTPEAGGLTSFDVLRIVRGLVGIDFKGFDLVEVVPTYDPSAVTANLAANLAFEMLCLLAVHRRQAQPAAELAFESHV